MLVIKGLPASLVANPWWIFSSGYGGRPRRWQIFVNRWGIDKLFYINTVFFPFLMQWWVDRLSSATWKECHLLKGFVTVTWEVLYSNPCLLTWDSGQKAFCVVQTCWDHSLKYSCTIILSMLESGQFINPIVVGGFIQICYFLLLLGYSCYLYIISIYHLSQRFFSPAVWLGLLFRGWGWGEDLRCDGWKPRPPGPSRELQN